MIFTEAFKLQLITHNLESALSAAILRTIFNQTCIVQNSCIAPTHTRSKILPSYDATDSLSQVSNTAHCGGSIEKGLTLKERYSALMAL